MMNLTDKEKNPLRTKAGCTGQSRGAGLFDIAEQMDLLEGAEKSFQNGDNFFSEEHRQWTELSSNFWMKDIPMGD